MKIDRRLQRSQRTRENLLAAAKEVFLTFGYQKATISKINEQAKTGHGTFYAHFPKGKDEVLSLLMSEILNEFHQITDITFEPKTKEEAFAINHHQIYQFLMLAEKHHQFLAVFHEAIGSSQEISLQWDGFIANFLEQIKSDIQFAIDTKLAKEEVDCEIVARILLFSGEHFLWEIVQKKNSHSIDTIAKNITNIYMNGLYYD